MSEIGTKIDNVLSELGFEIVEIDGKELYHYKASYFKITYIDDFKAYVIEYANNYEEAKNNVFEDGDIYSMDLGENELIEKLKADLIKYYC